MFISIEKRSIRFENNFVQRVLATTWGNKSPWPFDQVSHEKKSKNHCRTTWNHCRNFPSKQDSAA